MRKDRPAASGSTRRALLKAAGGAAALGAIGFPAILRADAPAIKVGFIYPLTGGLSYSGSQCQKGAMMALAEINAAGGIKSLGNAKFEPIVADIESKPEVAVREVDKLAAGGVALIIGGYSSAVMLTATQAAARYNIPYVVDVAVTDSITQRGFKNVFRFGPNFSIMGQTAVENLAKLNEAAGKPVKTVVLVHEDGPFGSGIAEYLKTKLPERGFEVLGAIPHNNGARDFTNIALRLKAMKPDVIIPSNYLNEAILLTRTMQQQKVEPKVYYSVIGGATTNLNFVHDYNAAAQYMMDCGHWLDPRKPLTQAFIKKCTEEKTDLTYEVMLNYTAVRFAADALERAGSLTNDKINAALASSTFGDHIMPYGPTRIADGQNMGAQPVNTQIIGEKLEVIFPKEFASADPVFPIPGRG